MTLEDTSGGAIRWPDGYGPEQTAFHVRRALDMPCPPETIWPWLVRALLWPSWYPEFKEIQIEGGGEELALGVRFRWKAFGVSLLSEVKEFVPLERLGWTAKAMGIDAYHAWLIEEAASGCRVVSEENQNGWVARLNNALRPGSVGRVHEVWLERLREKLVSGQG